MEKIEELIEKYERIISINNKVMSSVDSKEALGENRTAFNVIDDLKQLKSSLPTQQDKVVVPEFVAEYLEMRKDQFQIGGLGVAIMHVFDGKESPKLFNWMNNNVEIFARAWLDDYTVEKEQIYEVAFYEDESDRWLLMQLGENSYEIIPESENDGYRTQWFTEEKIKAINEKYWGFRHPVDKQCQTFTVPVEEEE